MRDRINGQREGEAETGAARARGRPFRPGQSGNPRGKEKGTRNLATMLLEALLEGEAEEIGRKTIELALAGDSRALKACLDSARVPRGPLGLLSLHSRCIGSGAAVQQGHPLHSRRVGP